MVELQWAGETLAVLGEKALWWPRRRTICVADLHLGKAAAFRHAGMPVPEATTAGTLHRLSAVVDRFRPARLVILGDLLHCSTGRVPEMLGAFEAWRAGHSEVEVLLVRGNHDARAGDPPDRWNLRVEDAPFAAEMDGEILFAHEPMTLRGPFHVLCGHLHPAVDLRNAAHACRAACFWFGARVGVLPAFGSFTGTKLVLPGRSDRVFAVHEGVVVDVGSMASDGAARR